MAMREDYSDTELVELAKSTRTRREAHERIYARYGKRVLGVCLAYLDPERAQDAAQESFLIMMDAVGRGGGPESGKLGPWLYGVARNKVRESYRDQRLTPIDLPKEAHASPEWIGAAHDQADEARRRAEVLRLLDIVASGLTERQRRIYQLTVREELRGQALATALETSPAEASRLSNEVRKVMTDGFGSFLLAHHTQFQWRTGRGAEVCRSLLKIIREWNQEHGLWTAKTFPITLRHQVSQHVRNCAECSGECRRRIRPYLPGLIPVLFLPALSERMGERFAQVSAEEELGYADPRLPAKTLPRREKGVTASAASRAPGRRTPRPRRSHRMLVNGLATALSLALLAGGVYAWAGSGSPASPLPVANGTGPVDPASTDDRASVDSTATDSTTPTSGGTERSPVPGGPSALKQGALKITPSQLRRGQTYAMALTGFRPGEKIFVRGDPYRLTAADVTADQSGGGVVSLTVGSDVAAKEYTVTATGRSSHITATGTVVVVPTTPVPGDTTPTPTLTPSEGTMTFKELTFVPGREYPVTLTGFSPDEGIEIQGGPFSDRKPVRASSDGSTAVYLAVGRFVTGGKYPVTATGKTSGTVAAQTVSVVPILETSPREVAFRESVTITGLGFPANTSIALTFTPDAVTPNAVSRYSSTDCCSGNFTVNSPSLTYTITATGPNVSAQAQVTVGAPVIR